MGHTTQLRGMASTLRMCTAISPEQAGSHGKLFRPQKNCGLIDKKIKFRDLSKVCSFDAGFYVYF